MKNIRKAVAVLLCLCIALLSGCSTAKKPQSETQPQTQSTVSYGFKFPAEVYEGITVEDCFLYSGEYVEDGSFEPCENVAAIRLKNSTEADIQLMRVYVRTNSNEFFFEVTTLVAGATVIVQEQSKKTMAQDEKIIEIRCENKVDFTERVSLMPELFIVQGNPKTINIKNISGTAIDSEISIFYKKKDADGNYLGGITFRTRTDGLGAGAIKQLPATNFDPADSEVLFVDYAE